MTLSAKPPMIPFTIKVVIGLLLFGGFLLWAGVRTYFNNQALQAEGKIIEARVTAARARGPYNNSMLEIQYEFKASPDGPPVSASDCLGRTHLWVEVPEKVRSGVLASRMLRVRYWPPNPWVNQPEATGISQAGPSTVIALGGLFLIMVPLVPLLRGGINSRPVRRAR